MNRLDEIRAMLAEMEKDFVKFYDKQNFAAGTRVRKHMSELKAKAQEIRNEVQTMKTGWKDSEGGPTPPVA
jgi:hypothetical protein